MAMVINSNIMSLTAQRNLGMSQNDLSTAMERLSSGKRINSAGDDAAGLAISNRLTSQVRGLNQAIRNANDGISLIQTAEGALDETTNILQRMRELAIQSANGIYSDANRSTLQAEVAQLTLELDRIADSTTFNGLRILDGSIGNVELQVGAEATDKIDFSITAVDAQTLGMGSVSFDIVGASNSLVADTTEINYGDVLINGQSIVAVGETWTGGTDDMDELIDKINTNVSGVTASTLVATEADDVGDGVLGEGDELSLTINKLDGTTANITITDTENLIQLVDKLNIEGGGLLNASLNDDGKLSLSAVGVESLVITGDVTTATGTLNTTTASISLKSDFDAPITIERGGSGTLADLEDLGFRESNVSGVIEGESVDANAFASGDIIINGVSIGKSDTGGLLDKIDSINAQSLETGVTAVAFTSTELDFAAVDLTSLVGGDIGLNGYDVTITAGGATTTLQDVADDFNAESDNTGVTAIVLNDRLVLEGDVAAITFGLEAAGAAGPTVALTDGTNLAQFGGGDIVDGDTSAGGIKLVSDSGSSISVEHKDAAAEAKSGLLDANSIAGGTFGSSVNSIDVGTAAGATRAIDVLDNALEQINDIRSELGAINNRLDFTINNLSSVSENASASRSRIMDADFAAESAALSRAQVLQQAGTAMLAQANAAPQQVLSLLQ